MKKEEYKDKFIDTVVKGSRVATNTGAGLMGIEGISLILRENPKGALIAGGFGLSLMGIHRLTKRRAKEVDRETSSGSK